MPTFGFDPVLIRMPKIANADLELFALRRGKIALLLLRALFDLRDDLVSLVLAAAQHEPARTLRNAQAKKQNTSAEHGAGREGDAPAHVGSDAVAAEEVHGGERPAHRAQPEGAVDDQVDGAAHASRDKLIDGGVDRRVLPANAEAGDEAETAKEAKFHESALSSVATE